MNPCYAAGFIDAKSNISVGCNCTANETIFRYNIKMITYSVDHTVLERLQAAFGGTLIRDRTSYVWSVFCRSEVIDVLTIVKPYLIAKKKMVEEILRLLAFLEGPMLPEEEQKIWERIKQKLKSSS